MIMANGFTWGMLQRTVNDPTFIDDAIDEAINAHNLDPDAHMQEGEALQSHRTDPVADHPAESVVNDKIQHTARAYVAIVNPGVAGDFDTLQSAIAYATGEGGGTILLTPGDHYISGAVDLPTTVNLVGIDRSSTFIHGDYGSGDYLNIVNEGGNNFEYQTFNDIGFVNDGTGVIYNNLFDDRNEIRLEFTSCGFLGGGTYLVEAGNNMHFYNCLFECGNSPAVQAYLFTVFDSCLFVQSGSASSPRAIRSTEPMAEEFLQETTFRNCVFDAGSATAAPWLPTDTMLNCVFEHNTIDNLSLTGNVFWNTVFAFNDVDLSASSYLGVKLDNSKFVGNTIDPGSGNAIRLAGGSNRNIVSLNNVGTAVTDSGSNNIVVNNITS